MFSYALCPMAYALLLCHDTRRNDINALDIFPPLSGKSIFDWRCGANELADVSAYGELPSK